MYLNEIQTLVKNKINLKKKNYTVIIVLTSKTARSPIFGIFFKKTKMI